MPLSIVAKVAVILTLSVFVLGILIGSTRLLGGSAIFGGQIVILLELVSVMSKHDIQVRESGLLRVLMASELFLPWSAVRSYRINGLTLILSTDETQYFVNIPSAQVGVVSQLVRQCVGKQEASPA